MGKDITWNVGEINPPTTSHWLECNKTCDGVYELIEKKLICNKCGDIRTDITITEDSVIFENNGLGCSIHMKPNDYFIFTKVFNNEKKEELKIFKTFPTTHMLNREIDLITLELSARCIIKLK